MDMALSIKNNILRKAKFSIDKKHRYEQHLHLPDGSSVPVNAPSNIVRQ